MSASDFRVSAGVEAQIAGFKNFRRLSSLFDIQWRSEDPDARIPILLHGPAKIGKSLLADLYARSIYCTCRTDGWKPCFVCETCGNFDQRTVWGYTKLSARTGGIGKKIADVGDLARTGSVADHTVILVEHIDAIDQRALDALLKTLELRNHKRPTFIFTADDLGNVRRTIRSRSIEFPVKPLTAAECEQLVLGVLERTTIPDITGLINLITRASEGFTGRLLEMFETVRSHEISSIANLLPVLGLDWPSRLPPTWPIPVTRGTAKEVSEAFGTASATEGVERVQLLLIFLHEQLGRAEIPSDATGATLFSLQDEEIQDRILKSFVRYSEMEEITPMQLWERCSRRWTAI